MFQNNTLFSYIIRNKAIYYIDIYIALFSLSAKAWQRVLVLVQRVRGFCTSKAYLCTPFAPRFEAFALDANIVFIMV